jgi:hypothetical protein
MNVNDIEKSSKFKSGNYGGQSAESRWVVLAVQGGAESAARHIFLPGQLLPDRRGGRPESSLSLRSHGGGTPPLLAPGRVMSSRHILGV